MLKNKNNMAIWNSRVKKDVSILFQKHGNSIDIDKKLFKEDINVSIVHVEMLFRQKIIPFKVKNKIIYGLNKIEKEINEAKKTFTKYQWPIIDVTRKSVEETAASIIKIYEINKNNG